MADGYSTYIRYGGLENFMKPRLILRDGNYRWWSIMLRQMLRDKKVWGHVQGTVVVSAYILMLGAGCGIDML